MGRQLVALLQKKKDDQDEEDVEHSRWRYSLMMKLAHPPGHDPLKAGVHPTGR